MKDLLLTIDIGNTNTVLGVYRGSELLDHFRLESRRGVTSDEMVVMVDLLLQHKGFLARDLGAAVIGSVVPQLTPVFAEVCQRALGHAALVVGPGTRTGMPILIDNPKEVGADRIVNAVAAYEKFRRSLIVVDFGTATTFDYISAKGVYQGGAIAPGLGISAEALFERASKLPRVEFSRPPQIIAKNTVNSMQAGIFFGYAGLVDGIVGRMKLEARDEPLVVATGGLAGQIAPAAQTIDEVDPNLTLEGLRIIYNRNKSGL